MENDPIASKRSRGGQLDVGDGTDGAIRRLMTVGQKIYVIKERSIYEMVTADSLDPQRTNINVPNMAHKLVLNQGIESIIVSPTFLTAAMFFKKERFDENHLVRIWELIIELSKEAIDLRTHIEEYHNKESEEETKYETARATGKAPAQPSIINLDTILKTIFQRGEHLYQILMELASTLLPKLEINKQGHFDTLHNKLAQEFGDEHPFTFFIHQNLDFLKVIKELRNGLDHRQGKVKVTDYQFNPDTTISTPTISLDAKSVKLLPMPISHYLAQMESVFSFAEVFICHLASITVPRQMGEEIREIPIEKRFYQHVRYCFYIPSMDFFQQ